VFSRRCPNCIQALPLGSVQFDVNHSVICPHCGKPILATSIAMENKIVVKHAPKVRTVTNEYGVQVRSDGSPKMPVNHHLMHGPLAQPHLGLQQRHGPHGDEHVALTPDYCGDYG